MRGPLYKQGYRPRFSGHQTFALRYGWLKKTFDQVAVTEKNEENKSVFTDDDATAVFGVGKNMVASMRHWANAAGIIEEPPESRIIRTTKIGKKIFGEGGHDPYMEHPTTLWIVHWLLASNPEKATGFWAYSHLQETTFERGQIVEGLHRLVRDREWIRPAPKTVENDAACFVRTYAAQRVSCLLYTS
ncbi:MAG: DUF4007 family protein, partial [Alphaproteobacteria bacterium]|nr:DUF4007 family protein [Alphaproteobacteria bacterium]